MIRKVLKEIQKLEKEKVLKLDAKSKLEDEISEHTTRLKYLYYLKVITKRLKKVSMVTLIHLVKAQKMSMSCNVASTDLCTHHHKSLVRGYP